MLNKTRYFVLTAGAILVVGLTTGLVASYMGLPVAFSRAAGPDELQYVPADAAVVAYANVRDVMGSDFRERFRKYEPDTTERDEFEAKTGLKIDQDIHTVVAAMMPAAAGAAWNPENGGALVIARGRFEQAILEKLALEHGGKSETYQGKTLLMHVKESGEPDMALGFIQADIVAIGSYGAVKRAIDAGAGNNVLSNIDMMRQINELENNNAWAVGRFDAIAQSAQLPAEVRSHLPAIQWFSAAGHVNGGVSGVFKAEASDDESAQNMRDMLRGFLALAKMQAGDRPEIKTVIDSLQLTGDGKNVAISFNLPGELFDALEALAQQHHAR
jgi:hypothetical protein